MSEKEIINCQYCLKPFKRKGCYEKHIFKCERENEGNIKEPTNKELLSMINILTIRYNELEKKYDRLNNISNRQNYKLNILDWLNNNLKLESNFHEDIKSIEYTFEDLKYIFEHGFISGNANILFSKFKTINTIKCFNEKKEIIYLHNNNNWREMEYKEWENIISDLNKRILSIFINYQKDNIKNMEDSKFEEENNIKLTKLLTVNLTFEKKCSQLKKKFYEKIKEKFNN